MAAPFSCNDSDFVSIEIILSPYKNTLIPI